MALTLERWIALAVAGCLVAMALIFSDATPKPRAASPRDILAARQARLSTASARAAYRLRLIQLRDSVRAANGAPKDGARTLVTQGFGDDDRKLVNAFIERAKLSRPATAAGPVDYAILTDTMGTIRARTIGVASYEFVSFVPTAEYDRCLAMAKLGGAKVSGRILRSTWFTNTESVAAFLGPCSFYERFGRPGPLIDQWLRGGAWTFAASGTRSRYAIAYFSPAAEFNYEYFSEQQWWYTSGWDIRSYLTAGGVRCASGNTDACAEIFVTHEASDPSVETKVLTAGLLQGRGYRWWSSRSLGPYENRLLGDLAKTVGEERFRQFWTSPLPPAEAFKAATGSDAGAAIASWSQRVYGKVAVGPTIPAGGAISALALAAIAIGWAISLGRRRQVA